MAITVPATPNTIGDTFTRITGETFLSMSNSADSAAQRAKLHSEAIHWLPLSGDHEKEGLWARISPIDAARCEELSWRADRRSHTTYAKANVYLLRASGVRVRTTVLLHRFIALPSDGFETHHDDKDGLNCVRSNLFNVTHSVNLAERDPYSATGYYGVYPHRKKFRVCISVRRDGAWKSKHLGIFDSALEGAVAYDAAMRELHGPFVRCNFPLENEE